MEVEGAEGKKSVRGIITWKINIGSCEAEERIVAEVQFGLPSLMMNELYKKSDLSHRLLGNSCIFIFEDSAAQPEYYPSVYKDA